MEMIIRWKWIKVKSRKHGKKNEIKKRRYDGEKKMK